MKQAFKVRMPEVEQPESDSSDDLDDETMWEDAEDVEPWSSGERLSCFAHSLQLVINDGMKEVKAIARAIAKASKFTTLLRTAVASIGTCLRPTLALISLSQQQTTPAGIAPTSS